MKKLIALSVLTSLPALASAETYQTFGSLGFYDSDADNSELKTVLDGKYYFKGQDTVGPLDQFSYIDDTSEIHAEITSVDDDDAFSLGGSYYFDRFVIGAEYSDDDSFYETRLNAGLFILDNLKATIGYTMPEEGDDVADFALEYDHAINETDYIGFTLGYVDTDESVISLSSKYLNAFDNGQFLVVEASFEDAEDSTFEASAKWYLNKNTGFEFGADDQDFMYIGATHFFNTNFAVDVMVGQDDSGDDAVTVYGIEAVLQL